MRTDDDAGDGAGVCTGLFLLRPGGAWSFFRFRGGRREHQLVVSQSEH